MYQSKLALSKKTKQQNRNAILAHIQNAPLHKCKGLRRKMKLNRFLDANEQRKDAALRYQCFFIALDIAGHERKILTKFLDGKRCFEIYGKAKNGEVVRLHLREEVEQKDKVLYLISCFWKKKEKASFP